MFLNFDHYNSLPKNPRQTRSTGMEIFRFLPNISFFPSQFNYVSKMLQIQSVLFRSSVFARGGVHLFLLLHFCGFHPCKQRSLDPDQAVSEEAVWSGSSLFAIMMSILLVPTLTTNI